MRIKDRNNKVVGSQGLFRFILNELEEKAGWVDISEMITVMGVTGSLQASVKD